MIKGIAANNVDKFICFLDFFLQEIPSHLYKKVKNLLVKEVLEKKDQLMPIIMDIRDCLTVVQGLFQIENSVVDNKHYHVIMEQLSISNNKLGDIINELNNNADTMKQT